MKETIFSFDDFVTEYKSDKIESLTSNNLKSLKERIIDTIKDRKKIKLQIENIEEELFDCNKKLKWRMLFPFGKTLFKEKISFLNEQIKKYEDSIKEKKEELNNLFVELQKPSNENIASKYQVLKDSFNSLTKSEFVWDITTSQLVDRVKMRSAASNMINRREVNIFFSKVDLIKSENDAFHFQNANGGDIYIYPTLLIIVDSNLEFALLDIKDVNLEFSETHFVEEEKVPSDAKQVDTTWAKVNKDGSRDKRFAHNYQIPILQYGRLHWKSSHGFNEVYQFSNYESTKKFYYSFSEYQHSL